MSEAKGLLPNPGLLCGRRALNAGPDLDLLYYINTVFVLYFLLAREAR